jgi:hypothetical protein
MKGIVLRRIVVKGEGSKKDWGKGKGLLRRSRDNVVLRKVSFCGFASVIARRNDEAK